MYDFEPTRVKPDTQLVAETQKEFKHLGRIRLKPGHSLFAFNTKTTHLSSAAEKCGPSRMKLSSQ